MIQPVILCGGSGTRLWPLSREHHPKPLHAVNGERTLLQETALRCPSEPLVVCNESHRFLVQARMRSASYLLLPSLSFESQPRPLVEAFAHGLPVIASRVGRLAEMIEPGRNGLLFEPGSARDLARRLAWAEAFPEKMRQMGECAKADYQAHFLADWSYQRLYGERRRAARV